MWKEMGLIVSAGVKGDNSGFWRQTLCVEPGGTRSDSSEDHRCSGHGYERADAFGIASQFFLGFNARTPTT